MSHSSKVAPANGGFTKPEIPPRGSSNRRSLLVEGASEPPNLEGVVDLTNTVDTTLHTQQLPAVVHEYVTPTVHHVTEEKITREIHHHDVFHRIQPIVDVEILPTKHFVQNADGSLKEVPASQVPGRQNQWHIAPGPGRAFEESKASDLAAATSRATKPCFQSNSADHGPTQISHHTLSSSDGVHRSKTTWRHPTETLTAKSDSEESSSSAEHGKYTGENLLAVGRNQFQGRGHGDNKTSPSSQEGSTMPVPNSLTSATGNVRPKGEAVERLPDSPRQMKTQMNATIPRKPVNGGVGDLEKHMDELNVGE